jgi:hypothetical protein
MNRVVAAIAVVTISVLAVVPAAICATVSYQGFLYNLGPFGGNGSPVVNGRVIAGTFKPGFNVSNYTCTYGDFVCNLNNNNYSQAVADGNFIPLDAGVLTNSTGLFQGVGVSNAVGSKIWFFGFLGQNPVPINLAEVLATSSDLSFTVPSTGTMTVNAVLANQFVLGQKFNNGIAVTGVPIPEPSTLLLLGLGAISLLGQRKVKSLR